MLPKCAPKENPVMPFHRVLPAAGGHRGGVHRHMQVLPLSDHFYMPIVASVCRSHPRPGVREPSPVDTAYATCKTTVMARLRLPTRGRQVQYADSHVLGRGGDPATLTVLREGG